jgi:hypothetical protein
MNMVSVSPSTKCWEIIEVNVTHTFPHINNPHNLNWHYCSIGWPQWIQCAQADRPPFQVNQPIQTDFDYRVGYLSFTKSVPVPNRTTQRIWMSVIIETSTLFLSLLSFEVEAPQGSPQCLLPKGTLHILLGRVHVLSYVLLLPSPPLHHLSHIFHFMYCDSIVTMYTNKCTQFSTITIML